MKNEEKMYWPALVGTFSIWISMTGTEQLFEELGWRAKLMETSCHSVRTHHRC